MDNNRVLESSSKIREIARSAAKGNWWRLFLGFLIFMGVVFGASFILGFAGASIPFYRYVMIDGFYYMINFGQFIIAPFLWAVVAPLSLGVCTFLIGAFRNRKISYGSLFSGFRYFLKAFGLMLLMMVKILAWSLLLVVPGIIAAIRYSMSFFVLADHPDWKVTECIEESKKLMNGNKGKFFCLMLSFIGWFLLWYLFIILIVIIIAVIWAASFAAMAYEAMIIVGGLLIIAVPIMIISMIPIMTYVYMAVTAFYELACGNLVVVADARLECNDNASYENTDKIHMEDQF